MSLSREAQKERERGGGRERGGAGERSLLLKILFPPSSNIHSLLSVVIYCCPSLIVPFNWLP